MGNQELNAAENTSSNENVSFDVTFAWTERNVLLSPRHRVPRDVEHRGSTSVTIQSVAGAEAPIAFISTSKGYVGSDFTDIESEYRLFRGQIFVQADRYDVELIPATPEFFAQRSTRWVAGGTAEAAAEMAAQQFSGYLIVDGFVWFAGKEPVYEVTTGGLGYNHGYTSLSATTRYEEGVADEHYFAADEYELALAHALGVAEERGDNNSIRLIKGYAPIRVLIPEAVGTTFVRPVRLSYTRPYELTVNTFHDAIASFREQMTKDAGAATIINGGRIAYDYSKLTERQTSDYKAYIEFGAEHGLI